MNPLNATFEDYQTKYKTFLPVKLREGLTCLQTNVHHAVTVIDESFQVPEFVLRIIQLSVAILSFLPSIEPSLETPRQFCKDAKNFTNFMKGLKSVDGFLNFKLEWKPIMLNVSGMTLFIVSALSLIERGQLLDVATIKVYLIAIPIFGILPYGGLLPFSIVGLMGMVALFALEKRNKLSKEEVYIKNEKLVFWSQPLDLSNVQAREQKYQTRVADLEREIVVYEELIENGRKIEGDLNQRGDQTQELYTCCQALEELDSALKMKQAELAKYEKKSADWTALESNWSHIGADELAVLRHVKQEKWEVKLDRVKREKISNLLAITNNGIIFCRQALVIISVATGYGIIMLPMLINIGLDATVAGCGMTTFFMKRSIKEIQIPSIDLTQYMNLNFDGS